MHQFEKNIKNTFGKDGLAWLKTIPSLLKTLEERWNLSDITPVSNMSFHYVAYGMQNSTTPVVLKIGYDHALTQCEAHVLKLRNGNGYIKLLNYSAKQNALLLERALPGTTMKQNGGTTLSEIIAIYGNIVQTIDLPIPETHAFPSIWDWLTALDKATYPQEYHGLHTKALHIRKTLLESAKNNETLLHGDLHLDNILYNGEKWVCIDPKGVIGDVGFEIAAFDVFSDDEKATAREFHKRIDALADATGYPAYRLTDWFFLRLNLSAAWGIEASINPAPALDLAALLYPQ